MNDWFTLLTRLTQRLGSNHVYSSIFDRFLLWCTFYIQGRNWSNLATIRDQSCLNPIRIESRTQGDHEELKTLLQNCLISSRFNQELRYKEEEHCFIEEIPTKIAGHLIRWGPIDYHDCVMIVGHDPMISQSCDQCRVVWSWSKHPDACTSRPTIVEIVI